MAKSYDTLAAEYQKLSDEFTELNKEYNRAHRDGKMTDALELKFLKSERALHQAYRDQQDAKALEVEQGKHKPKKDKDS